MSDQFRILTFNTGLARLKYGLFCFDLVAHVKLRLRQLPAACTTLEIDLICFQEVYEESHAQFIIDAMRTSHPFSHATSGRGYKHSTGLLTLSRYPFEIVDDVEFKTHGEEVVTKKGFVLARFTNGPLMGTMIANVHFPYGGLGAVFEPLPIVVKARTSALRALDEKIRIVTDHAIILGDFNFGPDVGRKNFFEIEALKYCNATNGRVTWDTTNPLNRFFPLTKSQSIDHIFLSNILHARFLNHQHEVVFNTPMLHGSRKKPMFLSDHYGVICSFTL